MDTCATCKTEKPISEMYKRKYDYRCRPCNTAMCKRYRSTRAGKQAITNAVKKYEAKNPKRRKAWGVARYRISKQPCEVCGNINIHRHHPDVNKPLEVQFLCPLHHKQAHKSLTNLL